MKKDCKKKPRGESGYAVKSELAFACQECKPQNETRVDHGGKVTSKSDQQKKQIDVINLCYDRDSVLDRSNAHNLI